MTLITGKTYLMDLKKEALQSGLNLVAVILKSQVFTLK